MGKHVFCVLNLPDRTVYFSDFTLSWLGMDLVARSEVPYLPGCPCSLSGDNSPAAVVR